MTDALRVGYIAKYATKSTGAVDSGEGADRPIRHGEHIAYLDVSPHHRRMIETAWRLGDLPQYELLNLRRWAHMLAFRGRHDQKPGVLDHLHRPARCPPHLALADLNQLAEWLNYGLSGRDPNTVETRRILAEQHVIPALGARKLRELTAEDVDRWPGSWCPRRPGPTATRTVTGDRWTHLDLVFASETGTALDAANVRRGFRRVATAAGLDAGRWTPRELRHSFVSLLSDDGVPLEQISRLVGHSGTTVTELVYRKQIRPVVDDGATVMDRIFGHAET